MDKIKGSFVSTDGQVYIPWDCQVDLPGAKRYVRPPLAILIEQFGIGKYTKTPDTIRYTLSTGTIEVKAYYTSIQPKWYAEISYHLKNPKTEVFMPC